MANTQGRLLLLMVAQSGLKSEKKCNLGNILTASERGLIEEKKSKILMHNFFFYFLDHHDVAGWGSPYNQSSNLRSSLMEFACRVPIWAFECLTPYI